MDSLCKCWICYSRRVKLCIRQDKAHVLGNRFHLLSFDHHLSIDYLQMLFHDQKYATKLLYDVGKPIEWVTMDENLIHLKDKLV